jgi:6-phosphogluconate dehydrogenase
MEAQELGVPASVIEAALTARALSAMPEQRRAGEALFGAAATPIVDASGNREQALARLERALLAGKIAAYAQGFAVMAAASRAWEWQLPLGAVARTWRSGCIIRSVFLDDIARAYAGGMPVVNLMRTEPLAGRLREAHEPLRRVVAAAALSGSAVPALSAALAYFDLARTARTTADLIQAQRDLFGAHGFERTDREGAGFHGPWARG